MTPLACRGYGMVGWARSTPARSGCSTLEVRELGLDGKTSYALTNVTVDHQVRYWNCWHRHPTLCMIAQTFTVETRLQEVETSPLPSVRDIRTALAHLLANPESTKAPKGRSFRTFPTASNSVGNNRKCFMKNR